MTPFESLGLRVDAKGIWLLDQTLLPHEETWILANEVNAMVEAIHSLRVRGAPLIGVSAALCLGWNAKNGMSRSEILTSAKKLIDARPTAVNLPWAVNKVTENLHEVHFSKEVIDRSESILKEDVLLCEKMASHGEPLIDDGDQILTHCNTGGLATAGIGTALGVIRRAFEKGKRIHVFVDETRPLLQGARLTSWELKKLGIPHTLICDNMSGSLMAEGKVSKVFVGSDRIAKNWDFANKIGTYNLAVLSHFHRIPFYVVAPHTTMDSQCPDGSKIPIELRDPTEVSRIGAYKGCPSYNPAFDVTPGSLVSGFVIDTGIHRP